MILSAIAITLYFQHVFHAFYVAFQPLHYQASCSAQHAYAATSVYYLHVQLTAKFHSKFPLLTTKPSATPMASTPLKIHVQPNHRQVFSYLN